MAHEPRRGSRRGRDAFAVMLVGCGRVRAHLAGGGVALACALASSAHLTTSKDGHAESKAARHSGAALPPLPPRQNFSCRSCLGGRDSVRKSRRSN